MRIELEFFGTIVTKKNNYRAVIKKTGKAGLVKDRKLSEKLDYIVKQIPTEYFDLRLTNPAITMQRYCPPLGLMQDRDGILTTLLDLLVRVGLLSDDSDLCNNGEWRIMPTMLANEYKTVLTLETKDY